MNASVSVIIPTYNRASILPRTIRSVLNQGCKNLEILVVDDGSTDDTREVVTRHGPGIRYFVQKNRGPSAARNLGIRHATGDFIAFLDSDDEWTEGSLSKRLTFFEARPELDLVFSDFRNVYHGVHDEESFFEKREYYSCDRCDAAGDNRYLCKHPFEHLLREFIAPVSTTVIRRGSIRSEDYFNEEYRHSEDLDCWLRFSLKAKFGVVKEVLCLRHFQGDNLTLRGIVGLKAGIVVLKELQKWPNLRPEQRRLVRRSLASELFDCGYVSYWQERNRKEGRNLFLESFLKRPALKSLRCLLYSLIPGFHRLKSNGSSSRGKMPIAKAYDA